MKPFEVLKKYLELGEYKTQVGWDYYKKNESRVNDEVLKHNTTITHRNKLKLTNVGVHKPPTGDSLRSEETPSPFANINN